IVDVKDFGGGVRLSGGQGARRDESQGLPPADLAHFDRSPKETSQSFSRFAVPVGPAISSVTTNCPGSEYVCIGFCSVEVWPSPKSHFHDVAPTDSSVNDTMRRSISTSLNDQLAAMGF